MFYPLEDWTRKSHFDYYEKKIQAMIHSTGKVEITKLYEMKEEKKLRFYPLIVYAVLKAIDKQKEFRMGREDGKIGYYDHMHAVVPVFHPEEETFSDTWVAYKEDFSNFYKGMVEDLDQAKKKRGMKVKENQPSNFVPISLVPWRSFDHISSTSISPYIPLFPVITLSKYEKKGDSIFIPCSVNIFHGCADGYHLCKFYNDLEDICRDTSWMVL